MKSDELDELLQAFEAACLGLFRNVALLNPEGLPLSVEVQDAQGNSLLSAKIAKIPGSERTEPELVYLNEDHLADLAP